MPIPDYETLMLPILQFLSDRKLKKTREIINHIIAKYEITPEEAKKLIPSGRAKLVDNRVGWACTYLRKAGLIISPRRGQNHITQTGLEVLSQRIERIDNKFLKPFFQEDSSNEDSNEDELFANKDLSEKTPEEIIGIQSEIINASLTKDLLTYVSSVEPDQFEQLVIDLLLSMGYGGTVEDAGSAIGRSNDGGIDGLIKEDVLGLDTIYIQAKRWQNSVPIKEVRDFAGALLSKRSNKGVFITTSTFPSSAQEFVNSIDRKIILIDGKLLAHLMIKYNLGVSVKDTIEIKEVDIDYFET
jgi:restriction system protein